MLYREITDEERRTWSASRFQCLNVVPVEEPVYKTCPDGEFGDNMDECETCHGIGFVEIGDTDDAV